jgi:putative ABC transport system permease protein
VRTYHGSFLDFAGRRAWVIARPPDDSEMLPASSMVEGDLATATRRLRQGGWIAVSDQIADEHGVTVGEAIEIPTPTGLATYRVAATTTNLGWAPGAINMNSADYRDDWANDLPSALEVDIAPGAAVGPMRREIQAAVAEVAPGVVVQAADTRKDQITESAGEGLARLSQITLLLQLAAVLAMAAAMGAAIWQRRPALAALRIQSFKPRQLWLLMIVEASIVLGAGGLTGALAGIYGQFGADRFLAIVTGFPVAPSAAGVHTLQTLVAVVVAALAIVAVPGWFAARVPPRLGLGSE